MTQNHEFASDKKKKKDEYYTKIYAILPLMDYLEKGKIIWCPFDTEESNYVKVFRENGFNVISGHIADGKDFFKYEPDKYDYIISNPPFSLRETILERLFKIGKPFAMLLNISGLFDSKVRFNLFRNNPFEIMIFNKRVDYIKTEENNSSPPFSSIYLCSKILPQQFVFKELDKTQSFPPQTKSLRDFPTENIIGIKRKPCEVSQIVLRTTSLNSDIMFNKLKMLPSD